MLTFPDGPDDDRYVAGTRIETVQGRTGTLAGTVDLDRNPYVQFDSGPFYAIRPEAIKGTIARFGGVHRLDGTREAYDASQYRDEIKDGDVLWVPSEGIAAVLCEAWPVAVNEPHDVQHGEFHGYRGGPDALAAREDGRYAVSVQRATDLIAASPAGHTSDREGYADVISSEAGAAPAAAAANAGMPAAVTEAIREINDRLGYPRQRPAPCPGHMVHDYRPVDGITVTGDPYTGDRTQRLHIAGVEVGTVHTPPVTGSTAICRLPHQPGRDLRLFGCATPGSALNGLQAHVLTEHRGSPAKPSLPAASPREFPASPMPGNTSGAVPRRRAARAQPAPRQPPPGRHG